jgi:predicted porin
MKKTLIATAVAAVMAAPSAMAEITLGGQLQAEVVNASGDGVDSSGKNGNGEGLYMSDGWEGGSPNKGNASSFWVKGNHDIGNGLTGLYKLNFNPKFGDDFSTVGARDAFIGLKGGFGTILMGRLATPYKSSTVKWDPFLATFMQARGNGGMSGAGHNGYLGNVVAYANQFGPASFVVALGLDETKDNPANTASKDTDGDHAVSASLNVPVGPVELALAYVDTAGVSTVFDANLHSFNVVSAVKEGANSSCVDIS